MSQRIVPSVLSDSGFQWTHPDIRSMIEAARQEQ
jgi:NAD dependent epimerase/dehydratase family enzyme